MTLGNLISALAAIGFTGVAFAAVAAPVNAQSTVTVTREIADIPPVRRVSYADLNLASPAGELTLNGRVSAAVKQVCSDYNVGAPMERSLHGCRRFAWNGARPQIDLAVQRARGIALTGASAIGAVTITITVPQ